MFLRWLLDNSVEIIAVLLSLFIAWKQIKLERKISEESYLNNAKSDVTTAIALNKIKLLEDIKDKMFGLKNWLSVLPNLVNVESRSTILLSVQESIDEIKNILNKNFVLFTPDHFSYCHRLLDNFELYLSAIDSNAIDPEIEVELTTANNGLKSNRLWERLGEKVRSEYTGLTVVFYSEMNELNLLK